MLKAGLLGYPIDHSLSPIIHNAAYAALGLDWEYALYPCVDAAAFSAILTEAKANPQNFVGFNVTTPYKSLAYEACAEHSLFDAVTGSANVIVVSGDESLAQPVSAQPVSAHPVLRGDNTDGRGLIASLEREGGVKVAGASVVLCGTGPVAMSTLLALIDANVASVDVASRDPRGGAERVLGLCERLDKERGLKRTSHTDVAPTPRTGSETDEPYRETDEPVLRSPLSSLLSLPSMKVIGYADVAATLERADILIDATTVGMHPDDAAVVPLKALKPELTVLDVVYGHGETALIKGAREVGATAIDGLGMLIEQAALTIEIWSQTQGTPLEAPRPLMRQAAASFLHGGRG
ncbi:MAG: shikimate dehydrogenase [Coriobacteriales bacterium]|jgi:shikimate dehydrogenase|nr:shikimate dehydrogenase [Coriobacteriales bacterium]